MTASEIIAVVAVTVSALALLWNVTRGRSADISNAQAIRDKLDYISDTTRDTREDVRALDRKLDDHAARITKIEARVDDYGRRIEKPEG